jgi:hypothetical protein
MTMTRRSYALGLVLGPAIFLVGPAIAVSCSGGGAGSNGDAGADAQDNGLCQNGTIQLLDCEGADGAPPTESFTDEACDGLDTAETRHPPMADATRAPIIDAPTEGQALPRATPFTFAWHPAPAFSLRAPAAPAAPERGLTFAARVSRFFTLLPAAEAHCPAFGGIGYAVIFAANGQTLFRAETANHRYAPTTDAWMRLLAARGTISMTVEAARFANNDVTDGPVVQVTPRTFTIAP